jgi:hypothetical protein
MKIFAISGLGADKRVFDYLVLNFELILVDWIEPHTKECIIAYSKRLIAEYRIGENKEFGILGVSFGGLIATEISKLTKPKFTILISSIEVRSELNTILIMIGKSNLLEIVPEKLLNPPKAIARYLFGTQRKELLNSILDATDLSFTKWAIRELINWKNESRLTNLIKLGGSNDKLLPPKGHHTILIDKGGHFMIVDKAQEISCILNEKIQSLYLANNCSMSLNALNSSAFPAGSKKNIVACSPTSPLNRT